MPFSFINYTNSIKHFMARSSAEIQASCQDCVVEVARSELLANVDRINTVHFEFKVIVGQMRCIFVKLNS